MSEVDNAPRTYADRYVLGERVSASETTEVWQAHDDVVGRQVAVKIWFGPQAADPSWRTAFGHDAARLERLSHPGLAKLHEHGSSATEAWIAMTHVTGAPLADVGPERPVEASAALDAIGQAAIALQAAHDAGVAHGAVRAAHLLVRDGGVICLMGFALGSGATRGADLAGLGELARELLPPANPSPEVGAFVGWVTGAGPGAAPAEAGEIARTALALATSLAGGDAARLIVPVAPVPPAAGDDLRAVEHPAPPWDEASRRRVRNRLLALGTIVVIGGAVLLRFVSGGGGQVTVPREIGFPVSQAQLDLTSAGLRGHAVYEIGPTDSGGTVIEQTPQPGEHVKAGSTVTLTVSVGSR